MIAQRDTIDTKPADGETCPNDRTLSLFLNGSLAIESFNHVALHLNDCGECRGRLDALPESDDWVRRFGGRLDRQFMDEPDLSAAMMACVSSARRSVELSSVLPPVD